LVGQAAWRLSVSVREYRAIEAGERSPSFETWDRILATCSAGSRFAHPPRGHESRQGGEHP
jgi:hypothetical protein